LTSAGLSLPDNLLKRQQSFGGAVQT
jgi:hypothetical protein